MEYAFWKKKHKHNWDLEQKKDVSSERHDFLLSIGKLLFSAIRICATKFIIYFQL